MIVMIEWIVFWLVIAGACAIVAGGKGRSIAGWALLGAMFSVVALLVIAALPSLKPQPGAPSAETHRDCPYCAEPVLRAAIVCKHCGRDLAPHRAQLKHGSSADGAALVAAAKRGNWTGIFELLNRGADPNARDEDGKSALEVAEAMNDQQIVALLRSKGAKHEHEEIIQGG